MIFRKKSALFAIFAVLMLIGVVVFQAVEATKRRSIRTAKRESIRISDVVFRITEGQPEAIREILRDDGGNRRVFRLAAARMDEDYIGYVAGRYQNVEWREKELMIDPWGEPYRLEIREDARSFHVVVRSGGPDRRLGTSDDVQYVGPSLID